MTTKTDKEIVEENDTMIKSELVCAYFYPEWRYDISDEICGICRSDTTTLCVNCQETSVNITPKTCTIAKGKCGHGFHYHCLNAWLTKGSQNCPNCKVRWEYATDNMDTSNWKKSIKTKEKKIVYEKVKPIKKKIKPIKKKVKNNKKPKKINPVLEDPDDIIDPDDV